MWRLIEPFWDLCLFRGGPQDLPYSRVLLRFSLFLFGLTSVLAHLIHLSPLRALVHAGVDVAVLLAVTGAVLAVAGRRARFVQTASALAGTGAVIDALVIPVLVWLAAAQAAGAAALPFLLYWAAVFWSVGVIAHILRHALDVRLGAGVLCALGYVAAYIAASFALVSAMA